MTFKPYALPIVSTVDEQRRDQPGGWGSKQPAVPDANRWLYGGGGEGLSKQFRWRITGQRYFRQQLRLDSSLATAPSA
jgi:hypothetical protein